MSDEVIGTAPSSEPSLDEVRARLSARGLIASAPPILIPKVPRPEPAEPVVPVQPSEPKEAHWAESERDGWDVEPGPERVAVACPQCRTKVDVPVEATRVPCEPCDRMWRFAVCQRCDELSLTMERQESWRCSHCGEFTRSWWRTEGASYVAPRVIGRRRDQLAKEERARVREGMRRRRWKLVAFAAVAAVLAGVIVSSGRAAQSGGPTGAGVACPHFRDILEGVAAGRLSQAQLDEELERLGEEAGDVAELAQPVAELQASSVPTSPGFIAARGALVDACGAEFGRSR
jgi:hypothetical protein